MNETELEQKVKHWEQRLVEAEEAYSHRRFELNEDISNAEASLNRIRARIKEYEDAMEVIREADESHVKDLENREQALKARNRSFNLERQDFEAEKKRFYQTRELQS